MPDKDGRDNGPEDGEEKRRFIYEKIVRPRLSKAQIVKRLLFLGVSAVLFGALAAVTFVVSTPLAKKYLVEEETQESSTISIPKDEPETTTEEETTEESTEAETDPIEEVVRDEVERYQFSLEDLVKMYDGLNQVFQEVDRGIVTVQSVKTQMDWFDNPVEMASLYSGAVITATEEEYLILVPAGAVQEAEALEVTLPGGGSVAGQLRGVDQIAQLAVISIAADQLEEGAESQLKVLELGNSYTVRQGELVFAAGSPAGAAHSMSRGSIAYVAKNVQVVDGTSRLFYTDAKGVAAQGTFLFNIKGQMIGWVTDAYTTEESSMTVVQAISDHKGILEDLSNGLQAPFLGIMGLEVTEAERQEGLPLGIYVNNALTDGPAYNAGIQNGDIITRMGEDQIVTMKDFQNSLDKLAAGETVLVEVQRYGQEVYTPIEYEVTVGSR